MKSSHAGSVLALFAAALPLAAQSPDPNQLQPYKPETKIVGAIRVYGSELKGQVEAGRRAF